MSEQKWPKSVEDRARRIRTMAFLDGTPDAVVSVSADDGGRYDVTFRGYQVASVTHVPFKPIGE